MPSNFDFLVLLATIQTDLYRYGGPLLMALGTVSCILSLLVFSQKSLRKNPCSIYFIAYNVSNFLLIFTSILIATLTSGYFINPSSYDLSFCHFRYYMMFLFDVLGPCYLISASIDRIFLTSRSALIRRRSTPRLAFICITGITCFWLIGLSHTLVFTTFIEYAPGYFYCYFQAGIYSTSMAFYFLLVRSILIPLSMILLGLWTVKNVGSVARTVPAPGPMVQGRLRTVPAKDHQLIKMLLIDTSIYVIFNALLTIVVIYQQFTTYSIEDYVQGAIHDFLLSVSVFSTYVPFCIGCYTNLLVSQTFRHEMKKILTLLCK